MIEKGYITSKQLEENFIPIGLIFFSENKIGFRAKNEKTRRILEKIYRKAICFNIQTNEYKFENCYIDMIDCFIGVQEKMRFSGRFFKIYNKKANKNENL